MKKNDYLLIGMVVAIALILFGGVRLYQYSQQSGNKKVEIQVDGELYGTYDLMEDQVIELGHKDGDYNQIIIKNRKVIMNEANCPNQICVNHSAISEIGSSIVCLPHKVLVIIVSEKNAQEEEIIDGTTN